MTMMMMRMLENQGKGKESGDNGFMKELMQMQMMKMFSGGDNQQANALQRELADLKHQQSMYQVMAQQQQTQQGNQMSQEFMAKMENIKAERDKEIKKIELEAQKQRDTNIQFVFDTKLSEIKSEMQKVSEDAKRKGQTADLSGFKEQLNTVKELSTMVGERDKGVGEYISETITNVATQFQPAMTRYMEQKQQQAMQPQMMQQVPMSEQPQQPQENPSAPEYQEQEFPMPESDMSPSEKKMSETLSGMYNNPPEKKKE